MKIHKASTWVNLELEARSCKPLGEEYGKKDTE